MFNEFQNLNTGFATIVRFTLLIARTLNFKLVTSILRRFKNMQHLIRFHQLFYLFTTWGVKCTDWTAGLVICFE